MVEQPIRNRQVASSTLALGSTIFPLCYIFAAVVQAVVDPNEPELPGHITPEQALNFMEAMAKGDRERSKIIKTVLKNKIREVV